MSHQPLATEVAWASSVIVVPSGTSALKISTSSATTCTGISISGLSQALVTASISMVPEHVRKKSMRLCTRKYSKMMCAGVDDPDGSSKHDLFSVLLMAFSIFLLSLAASMRKRKDLIDFGPNRRQRHHE